MLDELARRAREGLEVPWDDLRHRRVLVRTLDELRREPARRPRKTWLVAAAVTLAAALIVIVTSVVPRDEVAAITIASLPEPAAVPPTPPAPAPAIADDANLVLVDGSIVRLGSSARVEIERESLALIELRQLAGGVHYSVPEREGRELRVYAASFTIIVAAAEFFVEVDVDQVSIRVERGSVEVIGGDRRVRFGAGEKVTLRDVIAPAVAPERPRPADARPKSSVEELLRRADDARRAGRFDEAAAALTEMLREHPRDPQVAAALFTLGRVERERGRHDAAGKAFAASWKKRKGGPLAGDALGSAAMEFAQAGRHAKAALLARVYLERYPSGLHAAAMYEIVR